MARTIFIMITFFLFFNLSFKLFRYYLCCSCRGYGRSSFVVRGYHHDGHGPVEPW